MVILVMNHRGWVHWKHQVLIKQGWLTSLAWADPGGKGSKLMLKAPVPCFKGSTGQRGRSPPSESGEAARTCDAGKGIGIGWARTRSRRNFGETISSKLDYSSYTLSTRLPPSQRHTLKGRTTDLALRDAAKRPSKFSSTSGL